MRATRAARFMARDRMVDVGAEGAGSSLAPYVGAGPIAPERLAALAAEAWREEGLALIRVGELGDGPERRAVEAVARRLYGERAGGSAARGGR